jgi:ribonuclease E
VVVARRGAVDAAQAAAEAVVEGEAEQREEEARGVTIHVPSEDLGREGEEEGDDTAAAGNGASAARKRTRRGSRGGRRRKKPPADANGAASLEEGSDDGTEADEPEAEEPSREAGWEYVPMSEWADDLE